MKLVEGQSLQLNGACYQIKCFLASGAVSDVYLAFPESYPDWEVIIKLVREDASDSLRIAGLKKEAEVLKELNRAEVTDWPSRSDQRIEMARGTLASRCIVALIDSGDLEDGMPFVVQEVAPGPFKPFAISSLRAERRMLQVGQAVARAIRLAHQNSFALKDFEPFTKGDRIRLQWVNEEQGTFELKIIDWNITGDAREFAQDLFYFGQHLYQFLTGSYVRLDKDGLPPASLGGGVERERWAQLTLGTRQILQRLLHRDLTRRYQQAQEVEGQLAYWVESLQVAERNNPFLIIEDRIRAARANKQFAEMAALAELALSLNPPPDFRPRIEQHIRFSQNELSKEDRYPIANAMSTFYAENYRRAVEEFDEQIRVQANGRTALLARRYRKMAFAGQILKNVLAGGSLGDQPAWKNLLEAVELLATEWPSETQWREAGRLIEEALRILPVGNNWQPVIELNIMCQSYALHQEGMGQIADGQPEISGAELDDWATRENDLLKLVRQGVEKLEKANSLTPDEPIFRSAYSDQLERLQQRDKLLRDYEKVDKFLETGKKYMETAQAGQLQLGELGHPTLSRLQELATSANRIKNDYGYARMAYQSAIDLLNKIIQTDLTQPQYRARQLLDGQVLAAYEDVKTRFTRVSEEAEQWTRLEKKLAEEHRQVLQDIRNSLDRGHLTPTEIREARASLKDDKDPPAVSLRIELDKAEKQSQFDWVLKYYGDQAQSSLKSAEQRARDGDWQGACQKAQDLLQWDGQKMGNLPDASVRVDPELNRQIFQLSHEVRDGLRALQNKTEIALAAAKRLKDLSQGEEWEYAQIVAELDIMNKQFPLNESVVAQLEQAKRRLGAQRQAEAILLAPDPDPQNLERAVALLKCLPTLPGMKLRDRAAVYWTEWAKKYVDPRLDLKVLSDHLKKGTLVFEGQGVVQEYATLLRPDGLLEIAGELFEKLDVNHKNWLALPNWTISLERLIMGLHKIKDKDPADGIHIQRIRHYLSLHVNSWQQRLVQILQTRYDQVWKHSKSEAQSGEWPPALNTLTQSKVDLLNLAQKELALSIGNPLAELAEQLTRLENALNTAIALRAQMTALETELEQGKIPGYAQFNQLFQSFGDHPDVQVGEFRNFLSALKKASEMEFAFQNPGSGLDGVVKLLDQSQVDVGRSWRALDILKANLKAKAGQMRQQLYDQLRAEADALPKQERIAPSTLIGLYWQCRYADCKLEDEKDVDFQRQDPGTPLSQCCQGLLADGYGQLIKMTNRNELNRAKELFEGALQLFDGRLTPPALLSQQFRDLPLVNNAPAEGRKRFALFVTETTALANLDDRMKDEMQPFSSEIVRRFLAKNQEMQTRLNQIIAAESGLEISAPPDFSNLLHWKTYLERENKFVENLLAVEELRGKQQTMEALERLTRIIGDLDGLAKDKESPIWVVKARAAQLLGWINELSDQLKSLLKKMVAEIFESHSAKRLADLIARGKTLALAQHINNAIVGVVKVSPSQDLAKNMARERWKIVSDATQSYEPRTPSGKNNPLPPDSSAPPDGSGLKQIVTPSPTLPPEVQAIWADLHSQAVKSYGPDQGTNWWMVVGISAAILLIVVVIFWVVMVFIPGRDKTAAATLQTQTGVAVVIQSTTKAAFTQSANETASANDKVQQTQTSDVGSKNQTATAGSKSQTAIVAQQQTATQSMLNTTVAQTATYEAGCQNPKNLAFTVVAPTSPFVQVVPDSLILINLEFVNDSKCEWEKLELIRFFDGLDSQPESGKIRVWINNNPGEYPLDKSRIASGGRVKIDLELPYSEIAGLIQKDKLLDLKWKLKINGQQVDNIILNRMLSIVSASTPTPTKTPAPNKTATPKPQ